MKLLSLNEFIAEKYNPSFKQQQIILEGGAFGHMSHPFEDFSLTFSQVKDIIKRALSGELDKEVKAQEKLDGQALAVSWKNGKLVAARNKGDRKNFGAAALSAQGVADKFQNHPPHLRDAFAFAAKDLEKALRGLKKDKLDDIFGEGRRFMHLEIIWPQSANVISYDVPRLVFHSVTEYDEAGNPIDDFPGKARELEKIIIKVNAHTQKNYEIRPPVAIKLPKSIDFSKKQNYFLKKVKDLQKDSGLSDTDRIGDYVEAEFKEIIESKDKDNELTPAILSGLLNRWVVGNKSYGMRQIKNDIKNPDLLKWIVDFDKKEAGKTLKKIVRPLELLFLELGSTILKNASGFLAVNPDKAVQRIRQDIEKAIKQIESSDDVTLINKLQDQMAKIDAIGGFDSIVPTEGVVFVYNGKIYKFTGAFAPVNQITGMLKFNR